MLVTVIVLDGSVGEGGGQVLRTALGLSLVTGEPFRMHRIRHRRPNPGLRRQHLTAVQAACELGQATVEGASLGSQELIFRPNRLRPGRFVFHVGSAGSVGLVLQAVLPALLVADGPTTLELHGGTHNPMAPPFEFLQTVLFPLLGRMGVEVEAKLLAYGFYPVGGGRIEVQVKPGKSLRPVVLEKRGPVQETGALVLLAHVSPRIGEKECAVVTRRLQWPACLCQVQKVPSAGPGNAVLLTVRGEGFAEVCSACGVRGVGPEAVAEEACAALERFLAAQVPVGEHLADQILVPLALAGGGIFRTLPLTLHTRTVIEVMKAFLPVEIMVSALPGGTEEVEILTGGVA